MWLRTGKETRDNIFLETSGAVFLIHCLLASGNSSIRNDKRMDTRGVGGEIQRRDTVGTIGRRTPSQEIIRILAPSFPPRDLRHRPF